MEAKHIEDFKGKSGEFYTANLFFEFKYDEKVEKFKFTEKFSEKNCICLFVTRYNTDNIISCFIEFKDFVDEETFTDIDINGFKPYGIAIIKSTKNVSEKIIKDLKDNEDFFFEKTP